MYCNLSNLEDPVGKRVKMLVTKNCWMISMKKSYFVSDEGLASACKKVF